MAHPLAVFREKSGLSKQEIAARAKTTRQTIHRIESGDQLPSLGLVRRLMDVTGLRADDFVPAREDAA